MTETLKGLDDTEIASLYEKIHKEGTLELTRRYPSPKQNAKQPKPDQSHGQNMLITEARHQSQTIQESSSFDIFDDIDAEEDLLRPVKITSMTNRSKRDKMTRFDDVLQSIARMKHGDISKED
ncbi:hypothetical protein TrispH2_008638 [Trichoplax sp. H2]|nr:hypothetical protein TrispH2_008638 [Trichoplax sp. H2]|eukprot:RDD38075.1 hypothetical protein TrispH2_008638 [Trichoplax sp. H2]